MQLTFRQHEQLFHELFQLGRSGVPVGKSLDIIAGGRSAVLSRCARLIQAGLNSSGSPGEAFRLSGFPESVVSVVEAAERTGTLPKNFERLAVYYDTLARAKSRFIQSCLYPAFILHLGALILPVPALVLGGAGGSYLQGVLTILLPIYLLVIAAWAVFRSLTFLFAKSSSASVVIKAIPLLGSVFSSLAAWKFSYVFALFVEAGGSLLAGLEAAARASGDASLPATMDRVIEDVRRGDGLANALKRRRALPELVERAIEIGEHSGRLNEEAFRAAEFYEAKTVRNIGLFAKWMPIFIYLAILGLFAYLIVGQAMQAYQPINSLLEE